MRLSVIVPVYNMASGDKLKWCLDSLVGQTLKGSNFRRQNLPMPIRKWSQTGILMP